MSLVGIGIENGFAEMGEGCIVVYPKRVFNSSMLKQVIDEIQKDGYVAPEKMNFSQPIVFKKKKRVDMTETAVKVFSLALSYNVDLKFYTSVEDDNVCIAFTYKGVDVAKSFDIRMLCVMESDYLIGWFEEKLQEIDEKENIKDASK